METPCAETHARVVLYGASWCGACQAAKSWLRSRGVSFTERDIEDDECARQEMSRRLDAAGLGHGSIPVIAVGSRVFVGFDPDALSGAGI